MNGGCYFSEGDLGNFTPRNQDQIIAGRKLREKRTQGFAQMTFRAIADDRVAQFFTGDERRARLRQSIRTRPQYNKRVGKCASF